MTAYVVYQGVVTDPEGYERYKVLAQESIAAAGGRYVARGGDVTVLEGDGPDGRVVLLEFPSVDAALAWIPRTGLRRGPGPAGRGRPGPHVRRRRRGVTAGRR